MAGFVSISHVLDALSNELVSHTLAPEHQGEMVSHISTDTRTLQTADIFLALEGERFDGHRFVDQAIGAVESQ